MNTTNNSLQNIDDPGLLSGERGFYMTPELSQRLDLIQHLIENSDLVPLVLGESGAGKSTLINQLQLQMTENRLICRIDANPMLHPDQLMVRLARFFGVSETDYNIRDRLLRCFESIQNEGRLAVIIVDDADQLPAASLIELLRLLDCRPDSMPTVALAFFAQPEIEDTITTPQLQAINLQQFHLMEMPQITREQASGYIKHLLEQEELSDQYAVIEPKLDALFRMSEGLPDKLTALTLQSINNTVSAYTAKNRFSYRKIAGIAGVVLVATVLLFQERVNRLFNPELISNQKTLILPDQELAALKEQIKTEPPPELTKIDPPVVEEPLRVASSEVEKRNELAGNSVADVVTKEEPILIEAKQMGPQDGVNPMMLLDVEDVPEIQEKSSALTPKEAPEASVEEVDAVVAKPEPGAVVSAPVKSVVVQAPTQNELEGTRWVLQQPATGFTLQLIGVSKLDSVRQFIRQHNLQRQVFYIKSLRNGRPWFVLLSGAYADRNQAKRAIPRDLPQSLQKRGIWARSFESLQQELKNKKQAETAGL